MATLTPDQVTQYYAEQGNLATPLSPLDWLAKQSAPSTSTATAPVTQTNYYSPYTQLSTNLQTAGATPTQAGQLAGATVTPTNNTYSAASGYTGPSITDFLTKAGQPSDYTSRTALASQYGIPNYTGTADQNTQLLHLLQGQNATVSPTGIPSNTGSVLGASTSNPTPTNPLNLSSLGGQGLDLAKLLGSGAAAGSGIPSDIAGLLSLYGAQSDASKTMQGEQQQLIDAMRSMGGEAGDFQHELDATGGYTDALKHVQDLSLQAAQMHGALEKFDVETQQQLSNIEEQPIPQGFITGQQAAVKKQRDLTRLSMAADLSATTSLIAAYQGNADTAYKLAKQSVDMKYAQRQNDIDVLKQQISFAGAEADRQESSNMKILGALLDYKTSQLSQEKTVAYNLQQMGVQAASGGAPLSIVQSALATNDPVQAASILSQYLKGPTESTSGGGSSGTTTTLPKGGVIQSGTIVATQGDIDTGAQALKASASQGAEADGKYADPNLYLQMYEHWITSGGKQADFFKYYPYSTYINPKNTWLSQSLSDFNSSNSGGGGGAQTP